MTPLERQGRSEMSDTEQSYSLTPQQRRALLSADGGAPGDYLSDLLCWKSGVRPWPTLDNLQRLGLCDYAEWDEDVGNLYELTEQGARVLEGLRS